MATSKKPNFLFIIADDLVSRSLDAWDAALTLCTGLLGHWPLWRRDPHAQP